jgi:hypothetical protein
MSPVGDVFNLWSRDGEPSQRWEGMYVFRPDDREGGSGDTLTVSDSASKALDSEYSATTPTLGYIGFVSKSTMVKSLTIPPKMSSPT